MAFSQSLAQAYADTYTVSELEQIRATALSAHANSAATSISFEGSSISIDGRNVMEIIETVQAALAIHAARATGCDPGLLGGSAWWSINRRYHRIS